MSNPKRIEVGDTVRVAFSEGDYMEGVVDYTPVATGDSWIILCGECVNYVQVFECMSLIRKETTGSMEK